MTCPYATWDGAYVLGALSPADREEFEGHLADCPDCAASVRGLAGLPGLLSRVGEQVLADPPESAPDTLLPRLVREVRRERRRRTRRVSALAAAASVGVLTAAVAVGVLATSDPPTAGPPPGSPTAGAPTSGAPTAGAPTAGAPTSGAPTSGASPTGGAAQAMATLGEAPVTGWLALETVPWGTRLTLQCTYALGPGGYGAEPVGYLMVVRTRDGREQQVATWNSLPGRSMELSAATATPRADIAAVEVRTDSGRPVLRLRG